MAKYSKEDTRYTPDHGRSREQCSKCTFFEEPNGCRVVEGRIRAEGWCMKYIDQVTGGKP